MLHYDECTLNRAIGGNRVMRVIDLINDSQKVERVWVRLAMSGESREILPKKIEADLLGRCLYLYTNDTVYKVTGKTPKKELKIRDAHFELRENTDSVFGSCSEHYQEKIPVYLKRDVWKVFAAFEDAGTSIYLVYQGQDLGEVRAIKSRLDGKYDVTTTDELRFVVKLQ